MRIDLRPWLGVEFGRDALRNLDASFFIGVGWREDAPEGEMTCRHGLELSWNWFPKLLWARDDEPVWFLHGAGYSDSRLWTGRRHFLHAWIWPRSLRAW